MDHRSFRVIQGGRDSLDSVRVVPTAFAAAVPEPYTPALFWRDVLFIVAALVVVCLLLAGWPK